MTPAVLIDLRHDTFSTKAEMIALINEKTADFSARHGRGVLSQIIITPHQHKLLKLELALNFEFRWKNLKQKYLESIDGVPIVLLDEDVTICQHCGRLHESGEEWYGGE